MKCFLMYKLIAQMVNSKCPFAGGNFPEGRFPSYQHSCHACNEVSVCFILLYLCVIIGMNKDKKIHLEKKNSGFKR